MTLNNEQATGHLASRSSLVTPSEIQSTTPTIEMNHPSAPSINQLPSELLAGIMQLRLEHRHIKGPVLRYPDVLSHVCSHWRQVAVHSRSLWSHIDISAWATPGSRAMTFLNRAGPSLLSLHITDNLDRAVGDAVDFVPLLPSIAPRLRLLELLARSDELNEHPSALSICLAACTAGNLTELVLGIIHQYPPIAPIFIKARDHRMEAILPTHEVRCWTNVDLPNERLEDILRDIMVLRLDQIYPQWTSSAYCGLVELRLLSGAMANTCIAEYRFINMLRSSPKLRILHFDLTIVDATPLDTAIADPIALHDLEVLNLDWMQEDGIEILFRWLTPAPKLFQFSFCPFDSENFGHPATVAFLAGSNITMLHTNLLSLRGVVSLIDLCHHIRVLALDDIELNEDTEGTVSFQLDTLYLIESEIKVECLRRMIHPGSVQKLITYHSVFHRDRSALLSEEIIVALSDVCSDVLVLPSKGPNPIRRWDAFWNR
ncbi:hypothetical protein B0J17DRAFT_645630 [Rhizoctonia solani]|nr:hypothetical protein B0J17DRAFT_645630 [Rhizoctonia solani]